MQFSGFIISSHISCSYFKGYGMTETGGIATVPISESFSDGCVGKLAPNIEGKVNIFHYTGI